MIQLTVLHGTGSAPSELLNWFVVNLDTSKKNLSASSQNAVMEIILPPVWNTTTLLLFLRSKVSCTYVFSHFLKQLPQLPQAEVSFHFASSA